MPILCVFVEDPDLKALADLPVGSMWYVPDAPWKGPDGRCLCIRTPGGDWMPDAPSTQGRPWQRIGKPPTVSAHPSIRIGDYHGWLRDGVLYPA